MHLLRAQQKMKTQADRKRHPEEFAVGDHVFLKLRPYRQQSLARRRSEKLAPRYYGPFPITARVGKVAYKLDLPASTSIHPVFHVSQLKRARGFSLSSSQLPSQLSEDLQLLVEPESVLGVRPKPTGSAGDLEVLLKWKSLPEFEATWEDFQLVQNQFPAFHLEDKVKVWAAGNDRPPVRFTYSRRKKE